MSLTWLYHKGTGGLLTNDTPSDTVAGYPSGSLFNLTGGSRIGPDGAARRSPRKAPATVKRRGFALN